MALRKLGPAFPQAPNGATAKHQIKIHYGKDLETFMLLLFASDYSAKHFVDAVVDPRPKPEDMTWERDSKVTIEWKNNVAILEGATIQDIFEYELTDEEAEWKLPRPYSDYAVAVREGEYSLTPSGAEKDAKVVIERREKRKERKPRASRDGLVSIGDICEEMGWEPREARGIMRQLEWEKPAAGWAWPKKEAEEVKRKLKKELKG